MGIYSCKCQIDLLKVIIKNKEYTCMHDLLAMSHGMIFFKIVFRHFLLFLQNGLNITILLHFTMIQYLYYSQISLNFLSL